MTAAGTRTLSATPIHPHPGVMYPHATTACPGDDAATGGSRVTTHATATASAFRQGTSEAVQASDHAAPAIKPTKSQSIDPMIKLLSNHAAANAGRPRIVPSTYPIESASALVLEPEIPTATGRRAARIGVLPSPQERKPSAAPATAAAASTGPWNRRTSSARWVFFIWWGCGSSFQRPDESAAAAGCRTATEH